MPSFIRTLRQAMIERYSIPKNRGENQGVEKTRNRMNTSLVKDRNSKNYRCFEQGSAMSRHRGGYQAINRPPIRTDTPLAEDSNNERHHHPKDVVPEDCRVEFCRPGSPKTCGALTMGGLPNICPPDEVLTGDALWWTNHP